MLKLSPAASEQVSIASQKLLTIGASLDFLKNSKRGTNSRELQILEELIEATFVLSTGVENLINDLKKS